jgi:hypothetical protein
MESQGMDSLRKAIGPAVSGEGACVRVPHTCHARALSGVSLTLEEAGAGAGDDSGTSTTGGTAKGVPPSAAPDDDRSSSDCGVASVGEADPNSIGVAESSTPGSSIVSCACKDGCTSLCEA